MGSPHPYTDVLDGWDIVEHYESKTDWLHGKQFGSYAVSFSRDAAVDRLGTEYIAGCYLSHALNRAFIYSTGSTLTTSGYQLFLDPMNPPLNWSTNAKEVLSEDDWEILQAQSSFIPEHRILPRLPLRDTVEALEALGTADPIVSQLIFYHALAISTTEPDLHFLMFAQGLEIVRELLPGRTSAEKHRNLPRAIRERLRQEVNWLFAMSQQRRETRHAIDKKHSLNLKPEFSAEEESDYLHDAEVLIRGIVCQHVGLPLAYAIDDGGVEIDQLTSG